MSDSDLRDIFRSAPADPGEVASGGRVPWWAVILGFLAALITLSTTAAAIMAVVSDTFTSWGGGWSELAMNALVVAMFVGGAALPLFALVRAVMAWANCRYWIVFVAIWAVVTYGYLGVFLMGGTLFSSGGLQMWLMIGAVPSILAGTVQYLVERKFRSAH